MNQSAVEQVKAEIQKLESTNSSLYLYWQELEEGHRFGKADNAMTRIQANEKRIKLLKDAINK